MWCSDCSQHFDTVAGSIVQVCSHCRDSNAKGKRTRRVPKLKQPPPNSARPRTAQPTSSNENLHDSSASESVVHAAHSTQSLSATAETAIAAPARTNIKVDRRAPIHRIGFGIFVFLLGQSLQIWAFVAGQLLVWSLANLISIFGITVALVAACVSLQSFDRRLRELARLVGRTEISARPRRPKFSKRLSGKRS